jgi:hypothetical protein
LPDATRRQIEENIATRNSSRNPCCQAPRIPTPEFGGYFPGANGDFLDWLEKRKAPQLTAKKATPPLIKHTNPKAEA